MSKLLNRKVALIKLDGKRGYRGIRLVRSTRDKRSVCKSLMEKAESFLHAGEWDEYVKVSFYIRHMFFFENKDNIRK